MGVLGQVGANWAAQPNDSQGSPVVTQNGLPKAYGFTAEFGSKITDFAGIFYEYGIGNTFPGWKGASGPIDIRATHFFNPGNNELLVRIDSNNDPTVQDVWNTVPTWGFPFYAAPQTPGSPASPMIASLGQQAGSVGVYALLDREFYVELSMYRVGTGYFRWMAAGTNFQAGAEYLKGFNPYWRAYWTKEHGPNVWMVGTFGMRSNIYPDSSTPSGPTDLFSDTGFDTQYRYLEDTRKFTLRASYIYEKQSWNASYALGNVANPQDNLKMFSGNAAYTIGDGWTFTGGYFFTNGSGEAPLYGVTDTNGNLLSSKPNTNGYVLEVERTLTQNLLGPFNTPDSRSLTGLPATLTALAANPADNNTLWITLFFAF